MNALDAGLLCTLLLIGTVAALLGGMSAARRRRRASFALCLAAAVPDFALLSVLLARLPDCETLAHAPLWTVAALISTALSLLALCLMLRGSRRQRGDELEVVAEHTVGDRGIALMGVDDVEAAPVPQLHVDLPRSVLVVAGDDQPTAFGCQLGGKIERPLLADSLDHPLAKASAG